MNTTDFKNITDSTGGTTFLHANATFDNTPPSGILSFWGVNPFQCVVNAFRDWRESEEALEKETAQEYSQSRQEIY